MSEPFAWQKVAAPAAPANAVAPPLACGPGLARDYLALVYELGVTAPWPALHRIRASGLDEVAMDDGLHVFRMRSVS